MEVSLKVFHTADIHIGLKFLRHSSVQDELIEARFSILEKMVLQANNEKCNLFIIAGDLFDKTSILVKDINRIVSIVNLFEGKLVLILPGNHDYISYGQKDLYSRFQENANENILILEKSEPYDLEKYDISAIVYPAVCTSKHSKVNQIGYIEEIIQEQKSLHPNKIHIGLAHGSLEGVSPDLDGDYYPMTKKELKNTQLDVWFLGHTHISYPDVVDTRDTIFYSGTPEPDGFDCKHAGFAWMYNLTLKEKISSKDKVHPPEKNRVDIQAEKILVGQYRFESLEIEIKNIEDLDNLIQKEFLFSEDDKNKILLKLKLSGHLTVEQKQELEGYRKKLEKQYFYFEWNVDEIANKIEMDEIEKEFVKGSFSYGLLKELVESDNKNALQLAYDLLQESIDVEKEDEVIS